MTISSETRKAGPYPGNGVTTAFPFAFKVFTAADLAVTLNVLATGVQTLLTLTSDYTVALNPDQNANPGGTVTYNPSSVPMPSTKTLTIGSALTNTQGYQPTNSGGWLPTNAGDAWDRAVILIQQAAEKVTRSLKFPIVDGALNTELPPAAQRARKALIFDAQGNVAVSVDNYVDQVTAVAASATAAATSASASAASASSASGSALSAAASAASASAQLSAVPTISTLLATNMMAKYHRYGGQLRNLHEALANPLEQKTGIVLVGDSITWGMIATGNAATTPRNHLLSDVRDLYASNSWANQFKRFISRAYFNSVLAVTSNWSYSTAGESTATFSRTINIYPGLAPITTTLSGSSTSAVEVPRAGAVLGYGYQLIDGQLAGTSSEQISFPFTGDSFTLVYTSIAANNPMDYELIVDGVSQGQFSTLNGTQNGLTRTHSFTYVRNKQVIILAKRTNTTTTQYLELEAIRINKTCSIVTQGIIGIDAREYLTNCFSAFGPSILTSDVNFAFVQLGTNDRQNNYPNYSQPNGISNFKRNLNALLAAITPSANVILMCANPVTDESTATHAFTMADARYAIGDIAKASALDMIDNYAVMEGMDLSKTLADGTHPNDVGHALIYANIRNALTSA